MSADAGDTPAPEGRVIFEKDGPVARVTFDNRKAHNALTMAMWHELRSINRQIAADGDIRVVTYRGAGGKSFISGTDISGFLKFESGQDGVAYEREMDSCIGSVEEVPQPTVAVIDGWCVGGGLSIAASCDFRLVTPNAKFGSPLAKTIGNLLSAKGYARLLAHVGPSIARRILILGEMIGAEQLKSSGIALDIVEPENMDAAVEALCTQLVESAPLTIKASKEAIRRLTYRALPDIDDLIAEVYGSDDFNNAVRAFLDKKPRTWTGR